MIADKMTGLVTRHYLTNRAHVVTLTFDNFDDVVDWLIFHEVIAAQQDGMVVITTLAGQLTAAVGDVISVDAAGVRVMDPGAFADAYGDQR